MLDLSYEAPQAHASLTIFPILSTTAFTRTYDLLQDALGSGTIRITEVDEGTVPELLVLNNGENDVLILDGEQLIGVKQNRMASRSIILPARRKTRLPVNCIESRRWRYNGKTLDGADYHSPSRVRRHNRRREAQYVAEGVAPEVSRLSEAQGDVWAEITDYARDLRVDSPTDALDDITRRTEDEMREWQRSFPRVPKQVGVLTFVGSRPLGLDVVMNPVVYKRLHERLVAGYIQDALPMRDESSRPAADAPDRYLKLVGSAKRTKAPSVGRGSYHVLSQQIIGGILEDEGEVVHLSGFPVEQPSPGTGERYEGETPLPPPSWRRRQFD
jgi:hypothetical protein